VRTKNLQLDFTAFDRMEVVNQKKQATSSKVCVFWDPVRLNVEVTQLEEMKELSRPEFQKLLRNKLSLI
jgi:hypothetical protein